MWSDSACIVVAGSGSVGVSGSCTSSGDDGILVVTAGAREDVGVSSSMEGSLRGVCARVESTVGVTDLLWYLAKDSQGGVSVSVSTWGLGCSPPSR